MWEVSDARAKRFAIALISSFYYQHSAEFANCWNHIALGFVWRKMVNIFYGVVAFMCTGAAIALAVSHIYRHLLNYTEPTYQRFIVRIIFMVPVSFSTYSLPSFWDLFAALRFLFLFILMFVSACWQVYALMSFLALILPDSAIYFNSIREV